VGYVTRGKGVAVHAKSCPNVENLMYEADRRIAVEWARSASTLAEDGYAVKLSVYCDDRYGMLKQMTSVITDQKSNIRNIEAHTANTQATIDIVLDIEDVGHLQRIITGLRKIPGVHDVQRVQRQ
jgi:GTP pyrophosphokinase